MPMDAPLWIKLSITMAGDRVVLTPQGSRGDGGTVQLLTSSIDDLEGFTHGVGDRATPHEPLDERMLRGARELFDDVFQGHALELAADYAGKVRPGRLLVRLAISGPRLQGVAWEAMGGLALATFFAVKNADQATQLSKIAKAREEEERRAHVSARANRVILGASRLLDQNRPEDAAMLLREILPEEVSSSALEAEWTELSLRTLHRYPARATLRGASEAVKLAEPSPDGTGLLMLLAAWSCPTAASSSSTRRSAATAST